MAMRLQELHPALVHFPIALLPTALGADALGRFTSNPALLKMGKTTIALTAGSAVISALAGLIAQEEAKFTGHTHDLLVTHRNLNLGLVGLTGLMALKRSRRRRPSLGYLAAGVAGLGVMSYSAYLGGHMVYEHGVGVKAAGGLRDGDAPELTPDNAPMVARRSAAHIRTGFRHAVEHLAEGDIVPALSERHTGPDTEPGPG